MKIDDAFFRERIYELVMGNINLEEYPVPEQVCDKCVFDREQVCGVI